MTTIHLVATAQPVEKASASAHHRPSPYMRRVRLPRLDFSNQPQHSMNNYLPYAADDDLPSPEELIAKLEFLKLKNEEASQRYNIGEKKCHNPPPPPPPPHPSDQSFGRNWKKEMPEIGRKHEQRSASMCRPSPTASTNTPFSNKSANQQRQQPKSVIHRDMEKRNNNNHLMAAAGSTKTNHQRNLNETSSRQPNENIRK